MAKESQIVGPTGKKALAKKDCQ